MKCAEPTALVNSDGILFNGLKSVVTTLVDATHLREKDFC